MQPKHINPNNSRFYILNLLVFFTLISCTPKPSKKNIHDLIGKSEWTFNSFIQGVKLDSININSKPGLKISATLKKSDPPVALSARFNVFKYIPVKKEYPNSKKGRIVLEYKNPNYSDVKLTAIGLNKREEIVFSKTIPLPMENNWVHESLKINFGDAHMLLLSINTETFKKNSDYNLYLKFKKFEVEIFQDKDEYRLTKNQKCYDIINCTELNSSSSVNAFLNNSHFANNSKLLALGETVHGSKEINQLAFGIIKHQITNNNCTLVMLELPISEVNLWNQYIKQNLNLNADSLIKRLPLAINPKELKNFLLWLKEFNKQNSNTVTLYGIDSTPSYRKKYAIATFLESFEKNNPIMDTLTFLTRLGDCEEAYNYLNNYSNTFNANLDKANVDILRQMLRHSSTLPMHLFYRKRDSIMWENTKFAINNFLKSTEEKGIVYGHIGHLNKIFTNTFPLNPSFGSYMHKNFGEKYHVAVITVGEGHLTKNNDGRKMTLLKENLKMLSAPKGSIEEQCLKSGKGKIHFKLDDRTNLILMRNTGKFEYRSKDRFDSFFFIPQSSGFEISKYWPTSIKEMEDFNKKQETRNKHELLKLWK
ncbi:MAG: erythromycin esterase family protein [bacterium]